MEVERNNYASKGVAGTALGISIGSGVLALLDTLGGAAAGAAKSGGTCSENTVVSRFELEQTTATMHKGGYKDDPAAFYAVMNALSSDYGKTVAKHGLDKPDFWADITHDFLHDQDAVSGKVERYWQDIVEH